MKRSPGFMLVVSLGLAPAACDDDFLTTAPPDQLSDESFWNQEKDAVLAVNAIYPLVYGEQLINLEAASDNGWAQESFNAWYNVGNGSLDANNEIIVDFWDTSYEAIRRANELLANIDRIEQMDESLRERITGEARFHRAYHYTMLASLYGDVPLVLTPITLEESRPSRTAVGEVIDQVIEDLDFATGVLPASYPAEDQGRVTQGAALALKARAALYDGRWQVAAQAAQQVMNLGVYALHPSYAELFQYAGESSAEIILAEQYTKNLRSHNFFGDYGPRSLSGGSNVVPLRELVNDYSMNDGLPISQSPLYDPDDPYANRDARMYGTLLYPFAEFAGSVFNPLPDSPTADRTGSDFNATATGYQFIKYVDPEDVGDVNNSGINLILIRHAEVLLTYAEAKIEMGELDASVYDAINQVRERGDLPNVTSGRSQAELRSIVHHERRIEFAGEGLRIFDIRRWGIAEQLMDGQTYGIDYVENGQQKTLLADIRIFPTPRNYLWPIPLKEIDLNPDLGQNPGY